MEFETNIGPRSELKGLSLNIADHPYVVALEKEIELMKILDRLKDARIKDLERGIDEYLSAKV